MNNLEREWQDLQLHNLALPAILKTFKKLICPKKKCIKF